MIDSSTDDVPPSNEAIDRAIAASARQADMTEGRPYVVLDEAGRVVHRSAKSRSQLVDRRLEADEMITHQRLVAAAASFTNLMAAHPHVGELIQLGGPPLTRMECFLFRTWIHRAEAIPDAALSSLVVDLLRNRIPPVAGTDHRTWLAIDRDLLARFSVAARGNDDDLVRLWTSVMIWGYVTDNRGPSKIGTALSVGKAELVKRLRNSLNRIDTPNLLNAHRGCGRLGVSYLPQIGEPFFTKWFWAAGLGNPGLPEMPLTFDSRVRARLTKLGGPWIPVGRIAPEKRYVDYCELLTAVAGHLQPTFPGLNPEQIEYALYCMG